MATIGKFCWLFFISFSISSAKGDVCTTAECKAISDELLNRSLNQSVDPCEDFYEYVCGNWEKLHKLGETASRINTFSIRNLQIEQEVDQAIRESTKSQSHSVQFLSNFYLECNDTKTLESRGIKPLDDTINTILNGWPLLKSTYTPHDKKWSQLFEHIISHTGVSPIFHIEPLYVGQLGQKILTVKPGATVVSPEILTDVQYNKVIDAYKVYIRQSAIMLGATDNEKLTKDIERMIELEQNIARVLEANQLNMIHVSSFTKLNTITKNRVDWLDVVNSILKSSKSTLPPFQYEDRLISVNSGYLDEVTALLDKTPQEVVHNLLGWIMVSVFGPMTTHKFRENEAKFKSYITGVTTLTPTPQYCYNVANAKLSFVMGRVFVDSHFTPEDKKEAVKLVKEVKGAFRSLLETNTWLDEETRKLALEKLDAIKENIAYPEWVKSNSDLDNYYNHLHGISVFKGKFLESAIELNTLTLRHEFDTMHVPVNHTLLWPMTPATINAAYMPGENSITIPAAILKNPFFDKNRPFAMNYGAIGAVIGHELTHGFDNMGHRFDKNGQLHNWWTIQTEREFNKRTHCFIDQYNAIYDSATGLHLNGLKTLGENIADNGGVKEAFRAFHNHESKSGKSQTFPNLKLTADQLFFISYAKNWCSVMRKEAIESLIRHDPHPPGMYRVNVVVGNTPQFAEAFNCKDGSKMNPKQRCSVW